jgi:hypothetical protein
LEDRTVPSNFTAATVSDLIADINASNQQGGSNTITLVAPTTSPYTLTAVDNTTDGATGLPVITANDNLTIVGNGDTIARSTVAGTPTFRLLDVAAGATLTLQHLTLQGGWAYGLGVSAQGGAIHNQGTLDLNGVTVQGSSAQSSSWTNAAEGGGVYSNGALTLEDGATIQNNEALGAPGASGGPHGGYAYGGGMYVAGGTLSVANATLSSNSAVGGAGGRGRDGRFGVGHYPGGRGGSGGYGGDGCGGALFVASGTVTLTSTTLSSNTVQGGDGGDGGSGGNSRAANGDNGGNGGAGGSGYGGAVYVNGGTVTLDGDTLSASLARGGQGGRGGSGGFGLALGVYGGGGNGGAGGSGFGGGLYANLGTATLHNDTVTGNAAQAGTAGQGGAGNYPGATGSTGLSQGGGLYNDTIALGYLDAFTQMHIANNTATTGPNIFGPWRRG